MNQNYLILIIFIFPMVSSNISNTTAIIDTTISKGWFNSLEVWQQVLFCIGMFICGMTAISILCLIVCCSFICCGCTHTQNNAIKQVNKMEREWDTKFNNFGNNMPLGNMFNNM